MKSNAINPEKASSATATGGIDDEAGAAPAVAARMVVTVSPCLFDFTQYFMGTSKGLTTH
jgi:hypothetical protein